MVNRDDTTQANEAAADLLRAAKAFLLAFPKVAPEEFVRVVAEGSEPSITVAWRDTPQILVTFAVDGKPETCLIPLVGSGVYS